MADPTHLELFVLIAAPLDRVWAAMTEPDELRNWLMEEGDIDLSAGTYHLRSGTPHVSGDHQVTAFDPGKVLQLDWRHEGVWTRVSLSLHPHAVGTRLVLEHHWHDDPPFPTEHLHELWAYHGALLKTYLELGEAKCRLARDRAPEKAIRHVMTLESTPSQVFAALTQPDQIRKWNAFVGENVSCDGRVGGNYSFGWSSEATQSDGPGEIVEWEPDRKLTYRWHGDPPTLVAWTIEPLEGSERATRLTLVHSGYGIDQNMVIDYNLGWADFMAAFALWVDRGIEAGWSGMVE